MTAASERKSKRREWAPEGEWRRRVCRCGQDGVLYVRSGRGDFLVVAAVGLDVTWWKERE